METVRYAGTASDSQRIDDSIRSKAIRWDAWIHLIRSLTFAVLTHLTLAIAGAL